MDIVLATRNRKKIEEIKAIVKDMGTVNRMYTVDDFPVLEDVEEDGDTFEANAVKKAEYVSRTTGMTAVADDSGLEVSALEGRPGVMSARYAGESADDRANVEKLLREMEGVPENDRGARFVCCIALVSGKKVRTFTGCVTGMIGTAPSGSRGFGYDPVFYPNGHDKTFAEMSEAEKNSMSHRAMALGKLREYLLDNR